MKTTISIPDTVYEHAEQLARRLGKSRSQLYSEAVAEYVVCHDPEAMTEAINRVCVNADTHPDPAWSAVAQRVLERGAW